MASVEVRKLSGGAYSFRVTWREDGARRNATFGAAIDAAEFARAVEANGNRMPAGWTPTGLIERPVAEPVAAVLTLRERAIAHTESRDTKAAPEHRQKMRRQFERHLAELGDLALDEVTREHVQEWIDDLAADGKAPKTIKNLRSDVSTVYKFAVTDRALPTVLINPVLGTSIDMDARPPRDAVFLDRYEFDAIVGFLSGESRVFVELLADTGLRKGEALALRVGDLRLGGPLPTVSVSKAIKHGHDGQHRVGAPKTRAGRRTVTIDHDLAAVLSEHVRTRSPLDLVFPEHGNDGTWQRNVWVPAISAAMLSDDRRPRIHDLRHSHASWLLAAGITLHEVSKRLGHADIGTTGNIYGHVDPGAITPERLAAARSNARPHLAVVS